MISAAIIISSSRPERPPRMMPTRARGPSRRPRRRPVEPQRERPRFSECGPDRRFQILKREPHFYAHFISMEPTPEQVWMKVLELYSATTAHDQRTAVDTWLKSYQQSPSSWNTLPLLLRADGQGLDPQQVEQVHFFAANSLR
jgi:hypothetical protein